jgi:hypothetical protein
MPEGESSVLRSVAAATGMDARKLERLLPGLNALAETLLVSRARREARGGELGAPRLASLGLSRDDCRELVAHGLIVAEGKFRPSANVTLTDAGLALLQMMIPLGAVRPVYDLASRKLSVGGEVILTLAVQARNLSAFLSAIEMAHWARRVDRPLAARPCGNDRNRLAVVVHALNALQGLIDFHADDGAATWNWRRGCAVGRHRRRRKS